MTMDLTKQIAAQSDNFVPWANRLHDYWHTIAHVDTVPEEMYHKAHKAFLDVQHGFCSSS